MLHSSATCASPDVQDKRVAVERRTLHEFDFVLANSLQLLLNLFFSPFVAVDDNGHARRNPAQVELLKPSNFDRAIRKGIVIRRHVRECWNLAHKIDPAEGCTRCPPILWRIRNSQ